MTFDRLYLDAAASGPVLDVVGRANLRGRVPLQLLALNLFLTAAWNEPGKKVSN